MEYYNSEIVALMKSEDTKNSEGKATALSNELTELFKNIIKFLHHHFISTIYTCLIHNGAWVAELADARDLKSLGA
jgi:hypothetical protein